MTQRPVVRTRRIVYGGVFALLVAVLAGTASQPLTAQKNKPPTHAPATVVFADPVDGAGNPTVGLTSDGGGPYAALVSLNTESGDLRLDLAGSGRMVGARFGSPLSAPVGAVVPSGEIVWSDAVLFIDGVRTVPRGATVKRVGRIGLGSGLPNHAVGFRYTTAQGIEIYGTEVCVTRRDVPGAVWDIASSCTVEPSDTAGLFEENLKGKINHRFKATYTMPFALTATCTANCPS